MITSPLYITGFTPQGIPLMGGLWRMHRQEGFPLDISLLTCQEKGTLPDWLEILAEASIHNELPQLAEHHPIPEATKVLFFAYIDHKTSSQSPQPPLTEVCRQIVQEKRNKGLIASQIPSQH